MILLDLNADGVVSNRILANHVFGGFTECPKSLEDTVNIGDNFFDVQAKSQRKELLADSDWTQLPDSPLADAKKAEWATYRQTLRDITDQSGYPADINWPQEPS